MSIINKYINKKFSPRAVPAHSAGHSFDSAKEVPEYVVSTVPFNVMPKSKPIVEDP